MIVGVDVSSRAIHLAWLQDGKPQRWHQELAKGHLIDRLRSIHIIWPDWAGSYKPETCVTDVAVEMPFGQSRSSIGALMAVVGIVTKQAPPWARVAWPSSGELRAAIGAKNNKHDAWNKLMHGINWPHEVYEDITTWNDHECDALVAAVGWAAILQAQDAA